MHQCKYFHLPLETWSYINLKIETDNKALRFFAKLRYKKETKMFDNNSALKLSQFYIMYNFQHSIRFYILTTNRWITKKAILFILLVFQAVLFYFNFILFSNVMNEIFQIIIKNNLDNNCQIYKYKYTK